jgi:bifunctional UDP-N-acetylglucosamine pyrophosphorylase / glucosamine-1-phosphate N-acetyltransferase
MTLDLTALVLAAGKGTRMRSSRPKVLHPLAGRSLIAHVLATAGLLGARSSVVVLSPGMDAVAAEALRVAPGSRIVLQEPQAGTGHAVQVARPALPETGVVLVLYGDTPLVSPQTLQRLLQARAEADAAVAVLGMRPPDPAGYGRLLFDDGGLAALVEERHADAALRQGGICNSGVMAIDAARLGMLVEGLTLHPEKNEYYLTDIVARARDLGWRCTAIEGPHEDGLGINSQEQLAAAEAVLQGRLRGRAMAEGVTLIAPETVHLAADTVIAAEAEIGPYVVLGPGVRIGRGVRVLPFSHLEGVVVEDGARIGPFARLRPGTTVGEAAHVGNFVELKAADLGAGAKVNHLA